MEPSEIPDLIKTLCDRDGWTKTGLAKALGADYHAFYKWSRGQRMTDSRILLLALRYVELHETPAPLAV